MASIEIEESKTAGDLERSPKRLKIDKQVEEEQDEDDGWDTDTCIRNPKKYDPKFKQLKYVDDLNEQQIEQLRTYYVEALESHGFDIITEPPPCHGVMRPILRRGETIDPSLEKTIMIRVNAAIDSYNQRYKDKGKHLIFHKLITTNLAHDYAVLYYITLEAKDTYTGKIKTYQTRVRSFEDGPDDPYPINRVHLFRRQPKKKE